MGDEVAIAMPKNLLTDDRYIVVSDRGRPQNSPFSNFYFHIPAATATLLLTQLAQGLNQAELLFELALLLDEADYPRRDAAILRIDRSAYAAAEVVLRSVYLELEKTAIAPTPLGTKQLAPGVAVAEVATLEQNFGAVLWGAVAKGLARSWGERAELADQRWQSMRTELAAVGIDTASTHRITTDASIAKGEIDIYRPW
jgi:hypothetical protein